METHAMNRVGRGLGVIIGLLVGLLLATTLGAQEMPVAVDAATLTLSVDTTPAGGQNFWLTATSFQGSWGQRGKTNGRFRQPRDVAVDAAGNVYISDHRNSRIQKFSPNGTFLAKFGAPGRGNGKLLRPNAIEVAGNLVFVTDTDNHRMVVFNTSGQFVRKWGANGTGNSQFQFPNGVAVGPDGNVYVADTFNHRIQVFTADGTYLRQWGSFGSGDGQMRYPTHLDFDAAGDVFVVDSNNNRIQVFSDTGVFQRKFGSFGTGPGQFFVPVGIDIADDGFVYISDTFNHRLQKMTANGVFVTQWDEVAAGGEISRPNGLLVIDGLIYATDIDANRVQIYSQGTAPLSDGQQQALSLPAGTYNVTQAPRMGWTFNNANCTGGNPSAIAGGVRLTLADGAAVTCTFASSQ